MSSSHFNANKICFLRYVDILSVSQKIEWCLYDKPIAYNYRDMLRVLKIDVIPLYASSFFVCEIFNI